VTVSNDFQQLYPVLHCINTYLMRWIMNKYKKLWTWKKAIQAIAEAAVTRPRHFAHWPGRNGPPDDPDSVGVRG
jgi:hypothetical protein